MCVHSTFLFPISETELNCLANGTGLPGKLHLQEHLQAEIAEASQSAGKSPAENGIISNRCVKGGKFWLQNGKFHRVNALMKGLGRRFDHYARLFAEAQILSSVGAGSIQCARSHPPPAPPMF